ncbi:MAG TPA: serine/threonine-protein kinase, partial [Blastocatellia bacterium]|nr:serine/threonine-protein kinase [Blastocatellia bacterium]
MTPERWQEIKAVLASALDYTEAERPGYLERACRGDAMLRAEVDLFLAYDLTDETAGGSAVFRNGDDCAHEPLESETSRRIGPYKLLREIGRGGMGSVYLAERDDGHYRRDAAIKLIRRGMDTDFVLRRFRNERQILAGLDHPNIARLLDGASTDDGLPYLVMEYIDGLPINDYCDQQALDIEHRLKLFQQACAAVHYAHQRQVIHRDIKPSNILVTPCGRVKLLDFGIAKLLTPDLAAQTLDPTLTAIRLMTPAYASPEQIKGDPITSATDVYSLGVMLYELLTGHKPYRIRNQGSREISRAMLEEEPIRPSTSIMLTEEVQTGEGSPSITLTPEAVSRIREGSPDRLRRRLRGDLDNIVLMALRKDPARRYKSVEQFSDDIRRHLEGVPVAARGDTPGYRAAKFVRRNRMTVAVFAVLLLALGLPLLLGSSWIGLNSKHRLNGKRPSVAVLPFKTAGVEAADAYLGPGIADSIVQSLTNIRGLTVRPIRASRRYTSMSQDPAETGRTFRVDAVVEGTLTKDGDRVRATARVVNVEDGSLLWEMKDADEGSDASFANLLAFQNIIPVQVAQAVGVDLTGEERKTITRLQTQSIEAYQLYLKGRHECNQRTPLAIKQGIEHFNEAIRVDPQYAAAHSAAAFHYALPGNPLPVIEKMQRAKRAALNALELDETLAEAHTALGRSIT